MYCRVLAIDFDGTGATDGKLAPELLAALGAARAQGYASLLVTGRVFEDLQNVCGDLSPFDAVVAENGAVVCLCGLGRTIQLGAPPPDSFLGELRSRGLTVFALELMPRIARAQSMDALSSMATIAGYKAVLLAAERLPKIFPMLTTAAGTIAPARVFVVGAGVRIKTSSSGKADDDANGLAPVERLLGDDPRRPHA